MFDNMEDFIARYFSSLDPSDNNGVRRFPTSTFLKRVYEGINKWCRKTRSFRNNGSKTDFSQDIENDKSKENEYIKLYYEKRKNVNKLN